MSFKCIRNTLIISGVLWLLILYTSSKAFATNQTHSVDPSQEQGQAQGQGQGQQQGQEVSTSLDASNGVTTVVQPELSTRSTTVAIGNTAVIPATVTDCYIPKKKLGRAQRWLFGVVELSAVVELDQACLDAKAAAAAAQLAQIEAQNESMRLQIELLKVQQAKTSCDAMAERQDRIVEACFGK